MRLTRRAVLKGGGLALFTAGVAGPGPPFLEWAARLADPIAPFHRRKVLVTVFLRGAMDGLMAVSPLDDRRLGKLRPRLAMSAARSAGEEALIDLGVGFGLHPSFQALMPLWRGGRLGIVHAVGSPDPTRSHFDAQGYMETGTPGRKGSVSGWLNRVAGLLGHEASPWRSVALTRVLPRAFNGPQPAVAVSDLGPKALDQQASEELHRSTDQETFEAVDMLRQFDLSGYRPAPGADYPGSPLGRNLRQIALLIKARVGLEVAFAESGGWDTHVEQGAAVGSFAGRARDLARSIAALWTDLGTYQDDVTLLTMTEFGRTVAENSSGGTDHGHGSCLFVLGNRVDGGRVHGRFPGLDRDALYQGRDLPVTSDFRAVFSEVAGKHLGISDDQQMFPGWTGGRLPLLRA